MSGVEVGKRGQIERKLIAENNSQDGHSFPKRSPGMDGDGAPR
jgi:hypothetical protein